MSTAQWTDTVVVIHLPTTVEYYVVGDQAPETPYIEIPGCIINSITIEKQEPGFLKFEMNCTNPDGREFIINMVHSGDYTVTW